MQLNIIKFAGIRKIVNYPDQKIIELTITQITVSLYNCIQK